LRDEVFETRKKRIQERRNKENHFYMENVLAR
jgi:hypothetical protein